MFDDPEPRRRQQIQLALWNAEPSRKPEIIHTGLLGLDAALQVGGLPLGHIVELFGHESTGKTTIALQMIAEAQRNGCQAVYIDAEGAFDATYAARLGVNLDTLLFIRPKNGEQAFRLLLRLVQSGTVDFAVIDSISGLSSDSSDPFVHSGMCSNFLRRLSVAVARSHCSLLLLNQLRNRLVQIGDAQEETTTGGWSVKMYSSLRIDLRRLEVTYRNGKAVGQRTLAKVVKNRLAAGARSVELTMQFGEGFSEELDLLEHALAEELLEMEGHEISYGGLILGASRQDAAEFLALRPRLSDSLKNLLQGVMGLPRRMPVRNEHTGDNNEQRTAAV